MKARGRVIVWILGCLFACCRAPENEKEASMAVYEETMFPGANVNEIDLSEIPYPYLSAYGFFRGKLVSLNPQENVTFYEPVSSLFTDYAHKARYIWVPQGSTIRIREDSEEGLMDFPDNTILIKNFYYPKDFRHQNGEKIIIETRLLVKKEGNWEAYPYVWNEAQTDAAYKVIGGEKEVSWTNEKGILKKVNYIIPNKNQCKSCHNTHEKLEPIGVKAMHLNQPLSGSSTHDTQLAYWSKIGLLENPRDLYMDWPRMVNAFDGKQSLEDRARSYLDINCGHCHREEGPASTSGLFLTRMERDPFKLGIFKTPVAAGFGAGSLTYDVVPGDPDASILLYRMKTSDIGAAMPEIGRAMPDEEGVELIRNWIESLSHP